jgi:hypothetical protein
VVVIDYARYRMGPALIGTVMSAMLLGITYLQTFYYFISRFRTILRLRDVIFFFRFPKRPVASQVAGAQR